MALFRKTPELEPYLRALHKNGASVESVSGVDELRNDKRVVTRLEMNDKIHGGLEKQREAIEKKFGGWVNIKGRKGNVTELEIIARVGRFEKHEMLRRVHEFLTANAPRPGITGEQQVP